MGIALVNVSYKVLAKALALTINHVLLKIIQSKQMRFIRDQFILDNVCVACEGMDWAHCLNIDDLPLQ